MPSNQHIQQMPERQSHKQCANCGLTIDQNAKVCWKCGQAQ